MKDVSRRPGVTTFLGTACRVGPVCQTGPLEPSWIGNLYHGTRAYRKRDSWERTGPEWARFAEARNVRAFGAFVVTPRWGLTIASMGALVGSLKWGPTVGNISRGPEARSIPGGSAPGMETTMLLRAEGPTHSNGETVWREFGAFTGMLSHIRYV